MTGFDLGSRPIRAGTPGNTDLRGEATWVETLWHDLDAPRLTGLHLCETTSPSQAPTNVRRDRRLTAPFSDRPLRPQHAGAQDLN
jgi:hypothetical protein